MVTSDYNQWANARPLLGTLPAHVTGDDAERLGTYQLCDEIYWNVPHTFKVVQRGTDTNPIYIPSARMIVEATNRFFGRDFGHNLIGGTEADRAIVGDAIRRIFKREKFYSKFNSFKRFSLVRGDALWHIVGDPTKPIGRRISIHELQPSQYFPIYDVNDVERVTGCHIVQIVKNEKGDDVARRQTYRKDPESGLILSSLGTFELTAWDDRNIAQEAKPPEIKQLTSDVQEFALPSEITALPVYHVRNQWQSGQIFGSSDIRGFEGIISGINQGISDEDLTLALDGLGVFWTTADRPDGGWVMGPGTVIEGEPGEEFQRVSAVSSVEPSQAHLDWLLSALKQSGGTPDIAVGNVDVSVAESGIALAFQMRPILARCEEKEAELLAVHDNFLFDLVRMWLPAYEEISQGLQIEVDAMVGDPMPVDRAATIKEILDLATATPPIISPEYARFLLTDRLGYEFPESMDADVIASVKALSEAAAFDPFEERVRKELAADDITASNGSGAA
jgi:hypothetical protein